MLSAKGYALRLLGYRSRSRAELDLRLRKRGFAAAEINGALAELAELGLVDDQDFALSWLESRLATRPLGREGLSWRLRRLGVSSEIAEQAVSAVLRPGRELVLARELLRKQPPDASPVKWYRLLRRRGFAAEVAQEAVAEEMSSREDSPA